MESGKGSSKGEEEEAAALGTKEMGAPAAPAVHQQNQEAAGWGPHRSEYEESGKGKGGGYYGEKNNTMESGKGSSKGEEEEEEAALGTKEMGAPAAPAVHQQNQEAAGWGPHRSEYEERPYVLWQEPVGRPPMQSTGQSPMESVFDAFNSWTRKAENLASNVWHNIQTAPNKPEVAWGKLSLTAKAITEGGFESLYRQTFPTDPSERLKKTFACYLSTTTGPVAGTLYLSTMTLAFCSDRPLSFTAPSGQQAWSYYKVAIPLAKVGTVSPVVKSENERYIQVVTVDGHEFWFMGFVNYEKATTHLMDAVSDMAAARMRAAETNPTALNGTSN